MAILRIIKIMSVLRLVDIIFVLVTDVVIVIVFDIRVCNQGMWECHVL